MTSWSALLDSGTTAELLGAVVERERPAVVFVGVQSADTASGVTVALARTVGFEWAAVVNRFDLDPDAGTAGVHRKLEGGVEEVTTVDLPAVFAIQTGINEQRYASLRDIRRAPGSPRWLGSCCATVVLLALSVGPAAALVALAVLGILSLLVAVVAVAGFLSLRTGLPSDIQRKIDSALARTDNESRARGR